MGDDLAHQLGVKVQKTRLFMTFYAVMLASLSTAAIGPIAFIALAAPQVARLLIRAKSVPVFTSALMGSALLLSSDWLTLTLPFAMSFPIGLMTAFIGGLYLLWLVTRNRY
jgi:iron complex transport system permease protein